MFARNRSYRRYVAIHPGKNTNCCKGWFKNVKICKEIDFVHSVCVCNVPESYHPYPAKTIETVDDDAASSWMDEDVANTSRVPRQCIVDLRH